MMKNWLLATTALSAPETGAGSGAPPTNAEPAISAPAALTTPSAAAPAVDEGGGDGLDFDAGADDFDVATLDQSAISPASQTSADPPAAAPSQSAGDIAPPATPAAVAPVAPTTPAAPAAPAVPAAPAAAPAAPVAALAPAALPPAGPTPGQPPAPEPTQTLEQAVEARTKWRNDTIEALAKGHYNLSEAQVEEIQGSPEITIPKLMARVYLDATEAATMGVMSHLPQVITQTMARMQEAQQAEDDFYKAWPTLDKGKHGDAVMQLATAYRQLNPNASKDDFTKFVGSQAIVALGLTVVPAVPAPVPVPAAPGAPPFRPLAGSAPATRPLAPQQVSPFAQFAEEDLQYDRGE